MLVLGVETATDQLGVALGGEEGSLGSFQSASWQRHGESLAPAIDMLCRQAGVELERIGLVAVDVGPGLMTGLRIGVVTAKAIAHAVRVPMVGLCSLDVLAAAVPATPRRIVATVDARCGEIHQASYRFEAGALARVSNPVVDRAAALAEQLAGLGEDCLVIGDGAVRYAAEFKAKGRIELADDRFRFPDATTLVRMASLRALRGETVPPSTIEPLYSRPPRISLPKA
jgi:tRNA threonylcarbamoyladenosine biosynthesis protein TsaB